MSLKIKSPAAFHHITHYYDDSSRGYIALERKSQKHEFCERKCLPNLQKTYRKQIRFNNTVAVGGYL